MPLTAAQARSRIGVSRETLRKLIKDGELKAHKLGDARNSHYRIDEKDVDDYLARAAARAAS